MTTERAIQSFEADGLRNVVTRAMSAAADRALYRKTHESIGKPLPGRENIVISRKPGLEIPGVSVASSLEAALALCLGEPVAFVIGGGEIYKAAFPLADGIVLTEIGRAFEGDTKFPDWDRAAFRESQRQSHTSAGGLPYDFVLYERT